MEFFRGKRERSVLNRGGADIKWNSALQGEARRPRRAAAINDLTGQGGSVSRIILFVV